MRRVIKWKSAEREKLKFSDIDSHFHFFFSYCWWVTGSCLARWCGIIHMNCDQFHVVPNRSKKSRVESENNNNFICTTQPLSRLITVENVSCCCHLLFSKNSEKEEKRWKIFFLQVTATSAQAFIAMTRELDRTDVGSFSGRDFNIYFVMRFVVIQVEGKPNFCLLKATQIQITTDSLAPVTYICERKRNENL